MDYHLNMFDIELEIPINELMINKVINEKKYILHLPNFVDCMYLKAEKST